MTTTTTPPRPAPAPKALPRLTLRSPTPEPVPAPPPPKAPEPAPAPAAPPQQPEMATPQRPKWQPGDEPSFLATFRRLAALVPPGAWPATLPLDAKASLRPRPLAIGIGQRVAALLPEAERPALHEALRFFTAVAPYLRAMVADGAQRWADDGSAPVEPVSDDHRAWAAAILATRAKRKAKNGGG